MVLGSYKKAVIFFVVVIVVFVVGSIWLFKGPTEPLEYEPLPESNLEETAKTLDSIGSSVEGRSIDIYSYGTGDRELLFVGGVHGGYEWNSVLLAYQFIDYLEANRDMVPSGFTLRIIPNANPDGTFKVIGKEGRFLATDAPNEAETVPGRFNANNVDLNRNFDCKWQAEGTWRGNKVSAGVSPFSEPESRALRDLVLETKPEAVVFWHSQANAVFASECEEGILEETIAIMNIYASASGYPAVESFDSYIVTGDAEGWLASIGIPAITVELASHKTIEWEQNLKGFKAMLEYFSIKANLE